MSDTDSDFSLSAVQLNSLLQPLFLD